MRHLVYDIKAKMIEGKKSYFKIDKKGEQLVLPGLESTSLNLMTFLKKCFSTVSAELKFNVYIDKLIELLNEVLTYNQDVIKANLPGISDFFDQLHNLARLRIMPDAIKPGIDMLEFILRILQDGRYHTEGKPLKGVQIIGVLEARNLDFDCLILPFMNEGIFPRRSEKDMFINPALRKVLGLPTSQERDNLYYYNFTQLVSGKNDVFLLYVNEEKKDIPSRFITMIESNGQYEDMKQTGFIRSAIEIKKHSIKKDEKLMRDLIEKIKKRPLSYVTLSAYKRCPYRFYLNYMIGIKEQEEIPEEIDPQIWGKIFHNAVREFYANHFPSGFKDNQIKKAQQTFEEIVERYINTGEYLPLPVRAVAYFDLEVFKIHIRKFLESEILRFQNGYKIFPKSLEGKLVDTIEVGRLSIPLKGYVDRIDMKDGEYYIIDYKTGVIPKKKEYSIGEDFVEFQLPLYALMFSKNEDKRIGGMQYYKIASKPEIKEICAQEEVSDYLKAFRNEVLIPIIEEILSIEVPFAQTDDKDVCEYCDYCSLCGVGAI
jgi:RecB family exonuclease